MTTGPSHPSGCRRVVSRTDKESLLTQKIYVGNLPNGASEATLRELFAGYGQVQSVSMPTDRQTGAARGFAFVEMAIEDATRAVCALDRSDFGGSELNVRAARARDSMRIIRDPRAHGAFDQHR
jgi:RNA recognition motif-containing protein